MSLIASDYHCPACGSFESLEERPAPDFLPCPDCGELAEWRISAPHPRILSVPCTAVTRGGDTERRPGMLDTRALAEGQSLEAWKKDRSHERLDRRHKQLIARGLKSKRIQVG